MALPTRADVLTMDYSGDGRPFCRVAAKAGIELDGMDWSLIGSPWWGLEVAAAAGDIEAIAGETYSTDVDKVGGVAKANIQKIAGVTAK